jgi:hypothetical protein
LTPATPNRKKSTPKIFRNRRIMRSRVLDY